jgi:hypothetical protein
LLPFPRRLALLSFAILAWTATARAHRLDELLQATQISITRDLVRIDVYLTPGASLASDIIHRVDPNHDGVVDGDEAARYGRAVVQALRVDVDGVRKPVTLAGVEFPPLEDIDQGVGTISVRSNVAVEGRADEQHRLLFENSFEPDRSVYLVNVLRSETSEVLVGSQTRDLRQQSMRVSYEITTWRGRVRTALALLVAGAALWFGAWRLRRSPVLETGQVKDPMP